MGRSGRFYYCGVLIALVLLIVALQCQIYAQQPGGVSVGYYQSNGLCNADVEGIVSSTVSQAMQADPTIPAGLLRLLFHDCWVEVTSTEAFRAIPRSVFCWAEFMSISSASFPYRHPSSCSLFSLEINADEELSTLHFDGVVHQFTTMLQLLTMLDSAGMRWLNTTRPHRN